MSEEQSALEANVESPTEQVTAETQASPTSESPIPEKFGGDINKLVESYNHLESKMGSMYSIPTEDSSAEKWQDFEAKVANTGKFISRPDTSDAESMEAFYNQLGRPESPDNYKIDLPEEVQPLVDGEALGQYKQLAHQVGLNNDQAKALMDFELQRMNAQAEQSQQIRMNAEQQLRQNWGAEYDNRIAGAKAAASAYQEKYPDAINELLNGPAGNNPALIAMLSELGHSLRESGHAGAVNAPQYGMSADDAKDKIREIMDNKAHPYFDSNNPGHGDAVSKVRSLYSIAYPEG
jgi:hypothetical protein